MVDYVYFTICMVIVCFCCICLGWEKGYKDAMIKAERERKRERYYDEI